MPAGLKTIVWNMDQKATEHRIFKGAGALSGTLDNSAAVDAGSGVVTIPMTGHGFLAGSWIYIQGSTNYDGFHLIAAVATNTFNIAATYVAETFAGTEFAGVAISDPNRAFKLKEIRFHADGAMAAENLTITLDSIWGSGFDMVLETQAMSGLTDWFYPDDAKLLFERCFLPGDVLKIADANGNTATWGVETIIETN